MLESLYNRRRVLTAVGCAFALALMSATVFAGQGAGAAQKPGGSGQAATKTPAKAWSVRMSKDVPYTFTVKAKETALSEITSELSRLLKVPVNVSPLMAKQKVSVDFGGLNLEATLRMLAPHPFIDYVAGGEGANEPKPLAIYLQAVNERPPLLTATVRGPEAILIEGDTEEGMEGAAKKEEEEPVRISWANNQLSVRARKQPLSVVLYKIATEVGVPFELKHDTSEMVDVEFQNYPLDQAFRSLSPGVRFYYRIDLQTFQVQPLRLALMSPVAATPLE